VTGGGGDFPPVAVRCEELEGGRGRDAVNFGIGASGYMNECQLNLLLLMCVEELRQIGIGTDGGS
jgi:hypothetical protein